eukprot:scaffold64422_cov18-Tisochrysis_lutea.AAC.1
MCVRALGKVAKGRVGRKMIPRSCSENEDAAFPGQGKHTLLLTRICMPPGSEVHLDNSSSRVCMAQGGSVPLQRQAQGLTFRGRAVLLEACAACVLCGPANILKALEDKVCVLYMREGTQEETGAECVHGWTAQYKAFRSGNACEIQVSG